jgi:hypothetical protein
MFFAYMTSLVVLIIFIFALWKIIVKPVLESRGVTVDDEIVSPTEYEVRRNRLRAEVEDDRKDADAAEDMVDLCCEKDNLDQIIYDAEKEMKK